MVERVHGGTRWLDTAGPEDVRVAESRTWQPGPLPVGRIPAGKETAVLLRHGFRKWADLYPTRQLAVLNAMLRAISRLPVPPEVSELLRIATVGVAEMAGLASRWDRYYLKAYEAMAGHRFVFAPFTAEPNVWGTKASGRGTFVRRVQQLRRGASWFAARSHGAGSRAWMPLIVEGPSQTMHLADGSADLVLTDPPYYGDVQYGELSGLFRAWLGLPTEPPPEEVVVDWRQRNGHHYTRLLAEVLAECRRVLREDGRLLLTFHNRRAEAFRALAEALRSSGFRVVTWRWAESENERDYAKRDRSACTMDLLLECSRGRAGTRVPAPPGEAATEAHFLWIAGRLIHGVTVDAIEPAVLERELQGHQFLRGAR